MIQKMADINDVPKGMKHVLKECGINTDTLLDSNMIISSNHEEYRTEKTILENFLICRGHHVHLTPKFHCKMNLIEYVRGKSGHRRIPT